MKYDIIATSQTIEVLPLLDAYQSKNTESLAWANGMIGGFISLIAFFGLLSLILRRISS